MADSDSTNEPPLFEGAFSSDDVEQEIYAIVLQTRNPAAASAIADRVGCDPKTARKYLRWFVELGIVTQHEGHPTTYERNNSYFEWRRINQLAADHPREALQQRVSELSEKINAYEHKYEAATPEEVDAIDVAEAGNDASVDEIYGDLGDWATVRQERRHYERARQQRASSSKYERVI